MSDEQRLDGPTALIDLAALARNYRRVVEAAAPATVGAVLKANAYGLGVEPVAKTLVDAGCRTFFVATIVEGAQLRNLLGRSGDQKIFVLDGPEVGNIEDCIDLRLLPVLNSAEHLLRWGNRGPAALQVETGMNRLGLSPSEFARVVEGELPLDNCVLLMTHLACADEPGHPLNADQLQRFSELRAQLPDVPVSIGNSAGGMASAGVREDIVRAGIALYGGNPFIDRGNPCEPVVSLQAPVIQVRNLDRAGTVGYGASFAAEPGARIATVAIGYADGYLRSLGNRGMAAIRGQRVPVVGRVSMDLLTVDVSNVTGFEVEAGEPVELFGRSIPIDELAAAAGTISYELLTAIGRRVERRLTGGA